MVLFGQMVILFLIMAVGFCCRKGKLLDDDGSRVLSGIVVNVGNPALILSSGINPEGALQGRNLFYTVAIAVVMYAVFLLLARLIPRILRIKPEERGTYAVMTVFSNIGFMGLPVIAAVYGKEALLYAAIFQFPYNFLIYTYGIRTMTGRSVPADGTERKSGKIAWSSIVNIGVISCVVTLIVYAARIPVPAPIESAADSLSNLTAPLSMLVIGDSIAKIDFGELIRDVRLILFALIKLLAIPAVGMPVIKALGLDPLLTGVCLIMLTTPVGSMTAMLARQYGGDYELAAKGVAVTTVLSVATMPLMSWLLGV